MKYNYSAMDDIDVISSWILYISYMILCSD